MKKNFSHNYVAVLLEDMNSKFDMIMEVLSGVVETQNIHTEKLSHLETDVAVIKSVVSVHSSNLENHESRLGKLETTVLS